MKSDQEQTKIGAGHAAAMMRQGLRELRGAMYADSNVAQQPEYGLYGTRTPGEVAESRRDVALDRDEERDSALSNRLELASERDQKHEGAKAMERE